MNKIVLTLEAEDLLQLQRVVTGDDQEAALDFVKTWLIRRIPAKGTALCDSSRLNPYLLRSRGSE